MNFYSSKFIAVVFTAVFFMVVNLTVIIFYSGHFYGINSCNSIFYSNHFDKCKKMGEILSDVILTIISTVKEKRIFSYNPIKH
jgi:hypothetical protein